MNIVSAIRNLPEPPASASAARAGCSALVGLALGALLVVAGVSSSDAHRRSASASLLLILGLVADRCARSA